MMRTILAGGVSIEEMAKKRAPYAADTSPSASAMALSSMSLSTVPV